MIVDQDAHPPHHLPNRSRHGSGTACHDRQALVPPWAPLAHALAHSRGDGHQAQPEGLETIPSRSAQCWTLPREARSRLERSVEASIAHVSRAAGCHMAGSALAATARDQTSGGTVLQNASANPVTPAMAHGSKDAEGRLLGPSAATQRGYLQDRAPGAFKTDRPPVRSPIRRPATAPLVHTAHEMRGVHKRVCIW